MSNETLILSIPPKLIEMWESNDDDKVLELERELDAQDSKIVNLVNRYQT